MTFAKPVVVGLAIVAVAAGAVLAGSHANPAVEGAVKARKSHMQLNAHNLGILGGMAKGEIDFDAGAAQAAADNLVALVGMNQMSYWAPGSDNMSIEGTRLLPVLFDNVPDAMAKVQDLGTALAALQAAAGSLEGVQANIGAVGGACGACHKAYRAPDS